MRSTFRPQGRARAGTTFTNSPYISIANAGPSLSPPCPLTACHLPSVPLLTFNLLNWLPAANLKSTIEDASTVLAHWSGCFLPLQLKRHVSLNHACTWLNSRSSSDVTKGCQLEVLNLGMTFTLLRFRACATLALVWLFGQRNWSLALAVVAQVTSSGISVNSKWSLHLHEDDLIHYFLVVV